MKAFFIIPRECPIESIMVDVPYETIKEDSFFKLFKAFSPIDITNERQINDEFYTTWMCTGCTKSIGENICKLAKCGIGNRTLENIYRRE